MATIRIFSGGAPKLVFNKLVPAFERGTGHHPDFVFAVTKTLSDKLAAGESPDALVLPTNILDGYRKDGIIRAEGRVVFGIVSVNAVVKKGAPKPDLSTTDAFKNVLLMSRKLAMSPPGMTPSGTHLGKVIERLGLADALKGKLVHCPALEGGVELVGSGQADIGLYPKSEVIGFDDLDIVGPIPADVQLNTIYGGAVTAKAAQPDAAAAFLAFMSAPDKRRAWVQGGFDPA